jgi:integrase
MERKEVKENPVAQVDLFQERKRKRRLYHDERARLMAAISAPDSQGKRAHLSAIITLDLNTGLRRTELLSLKVADVDFQQNTIRATETKNGEDRDVEMNQTAPALLLELVNKAQAQGWQYLFTNPRTGTRYKDIKKAFKNACRDAGIEGLRLHDLRHEFASTAGDDPEVSVAALAETMGHKDWKTTVQYTHASRASKLKVVNAQERRETENAGHKTVTNEKRQAS